MLIVAISNTLNSLSKLLLKREFWIRVQWILLILTVLTTLVLVLAVVVPGLILNVLSENFLNYNRFLVLVAFITASFSIISLILINIRVSFEQKESNVSQFSNIRKRLRRQMELEKNREIGRALRHQDSYLRKKYESLLVTNLQKKTGEIITDWRESLLVSHRRLLDEQKRLLLRSRGNRRAGILTAFLGFYFLVAFAVFYIFLIPEYELDLPDTIWEFLLFYGPVFSSIVIIEILAMFFLRNYAQTENRLEKNKNELTNIELRLTAGLMLSEKTNKDNFALLADTLSKEERNFVLGKNESSAILDTDKLIEIVSKFTPKIGL